MKCINGDGKETKGNNKLCESCRMKKYRKDNPEKIKAYAKFRYNRDKEKIKKAAKEWNEKNKERYMKQKAEYRKKVYDYDLMAARTRYTFRNEKKKCIKCRATKQLQFHHPKPLAYDNFMVLCKDCHRKEHNRFVSKTGVTKDNQYTKTTPLTNQTNSQQKKAVGSMTHLKEVADTDQGITPIAQDKSSAQLNKTKSEEADL